MDNKLAAQILIHFDYKTMQVLKDYIEYRRKELYRTLETAGLENVRSLQGELSALKQLEKIRDIASAVKDKG